MKLFLSCDWGTSSFRLRLVDAEALQVLSEMNNDQGIFKTYTAWEQQGSDPEERMDFYYAVLTKAINTIESQTNHNLEFLPVIISGMASANIGMKELAYKELPVFSDGSNLLTELIPATEKFAHDILLVSGLRTETDVMRGEETQLAGMFRGNHAEQLVIFPGTHSKHVHVADGYIQSITTYMTGEFFELLSRKSILTGSVEQDPVITDPQRKEAFRKGVETGSRYSLLHGSFMVRTNRLFEKLNKSENYFYLSGLLIGSELNELDGINIPILIVADKNKQEWYSLASAILGLDPVDCTDVDHAILKGHVLLYGNYFAHR